MKHKPYSFTLLAFLVAVLTLIGCDDKIQPDQRIVDQMNAQRKHQEKSGDRGRNVPAPGTNPYTTGSSRSKSADPGTGG